MQPTKCVVWFPQGLDHFISLFLNFHIFNLGFHILGTLVGSTSFVELFVTEVLYEDLGTIFNLPVFVNPPVAFVMLLLCYTQRPSYLLRTMFPFLGIL